MREVRAANENLELYFLNKALIEKIELQILARVKLQHAIQPAGTGAEQAPHPHADTPEFPL